MKARLRQQCPLCLWSVERLIDGLCCDCAKEWREMDEKIRKEKVEREMDEAAVEAEIDSLNLGE